MSEPIDTAVVANGSDTEVHSPDVLKQFQRAIEKVGKEQGKTTQLTEAELTELICHWESQRDILCLYVRWARQVKRNFNVDSMATLVCLSRQCGYTPVDFLRKVKTLSIRKYQTADYGVTFRFVIPKRKDINKEFLRKEFFALSVTLTLLQEEVSTIPKDLHKNLQQGILVPSPPSPQLPTQATLQKRIWNSFSHRWLALYLLEHIFREIEVGQAWSYTDAMLYTLQMMGPCGPGRYEFLSPLVGYCLKFPTEDSLQSRRLKLREIWKDPTLFLAYGNTCLSQLSIEHQSQIIISCFQDLHSILPSNHKQLSYNRHCSLDKRWILLRAYSFHLWLQGTSNETLKSMVKNSSSSGTTSTAPTKRKVSTNLKKPPLYSIPTQSPVNSKKQRIGNPQSTGERNPPQQETLTISTNAQGALQKSIKDTNWSDLHQIGMTENNEEDRYGLCTYVGIAATIGSSTYESNL
jgi:hypothetical protein